MTTPQQAAIRNQLMAEHVPYEIWMMQTTHEALAAGFFGYGGVATNAFIESFAVHARALIAFFRSTSDFDDDSKATHFTDAAYTPFAAGDVPKELTDKINKQIAHITEKRVIDPQAKLHSEDIGKLRGLLDREIVRFLAHLTPQYRLLWNTSAKAYIQLPHAASLSAASEAAV